MKYQPNEVSFLPVWEKRSEQMRTEPVFIANEYTDAVLVSAEGDVWHGKGVGVCGLVQGEICFNTSMSGYQEVITDPSYAGQIITFTFPHIGNVGCNAADFESQTVSCKGVVLREQITPPSNFRATDSFSYWLVKNHVTGICEIDTRSLTKSIRNKGTRNFAIYYAKPGEEIKTPEIHTKIMEYPPLQGQDIATTVSTKHCLEDKNKQGRYHIVAIDFGMKESIKNYFSEYDFSVTIVPAQTSFADILAYTPDGIFLSNGPGDPLATFTKVGQTITKILDYNIPLFGICLGHQLLALASGIRTLKLRCGHHGVNHPVKNLRTGKVEVTSQNHVFCAERETIPNYVEITHESLFDGTIEGIRRRDKNAFSVQYHPESSPGPQDSNYLFADFYSLIRRAKKQRNMEQCPKEKILPLSW